MDSLFSCVFLNDDLFYQICQFCDALTLERLMFTCRAFKKKLINAPYSVHVRRLGFFLGITYSMKNIMMYGHKENEKLGITVYQYVNWTRHLLGHKNESNEKAVKAKIYDWTTLFLSTFEGSTKAEMGEMKYYFFLAFLKKFDLDKCVHILLKGGSLPIEVKALLNNSHLPPTNKSAGILFTGEYENKLNMKINYNCTFSSNWHLLLHNYYGQFVFNNAHVIEKLSAKKEKIEDCTLVYPEIRLFDTQLFPIVAAAPSVTPIVILNLAINVFLCGSIQCIRKFLESFKEQPDELKNQSMIIYKHILFVVNNVIITAESLSMAQGRLGRLLKNYNISYALTADYCWPTIHKRCKIIQRWLNLNDIPDTVAYDYSSFCAMFPVLDAPYTFAKTLEQKAFKLPLSFISPNSSLTLYTLVYHYGYDIKLLSPTSHLRLLNMNWTDFITNYKSVVDKIDNIDELNTFLVLLYSLYYNNSLTAKKIVPEFIIQKLDTLKIDRSVSTVVIFFITTYLSSAVFRIQQNTETFLCKWIMCVYTPTMSYNFLFTFYKVLWKKWRETRNILFLRSIGLLWGNIWSPVCDLRLSNTLIHEEEKKLLFFFVVAGLKLEVPLILQSSIYQNINIADIANWVSLYNEYDLLKSVHGYYFIGILRSFSTFNINIDESLQLVLLAYDWVHNGKFSVLSWFEFTFVKKLQAFIEFLKIVDLDCKEFEINSTMTSKISSDFLKNSNNKDDEDSKYFTFIFFQNPCENMLDKWEEIIYKYKLHYFAKKQVSAILSRRVYDLLGRNDFV